MEEKYNLYKRPHSGEICMLCPCVRFFFFLFTACMIFLGCKTWQSCPQWLGIELWDKHAKFRTISQCLWGLPESNLPVPHPRAWTSARVGGGGRGAGERGMPALQPETNKTGETQRTPSLYPAQQELSKLNILKLLHRGSSWVSRAQLSALTTIWPLRCKCDWCRRARPRVATCIAVCLGPWDSSWQPIPDTPLRNKDKARTPFPGCRLQGTQQLCSLDTKYPPDQQDWASIWPEGLCRRHSILSDKETGIQCFKPFMNFKKFIYWITEGKNTYFIQVKESLCISQSFFMVLGCSPNFPREEGMSVMIRAADSTYSLKKMTIKIPINIMIMINPNQDNGVPDSTLSLQAVKNFLQACCSHQHTKKPSFSYVQTYRTDL